MWIIKHFLSEGPGTEESLFHHRDHLEVVSSASRKGTQSFSKMYLLGLTLYVQLRDQDDVPCCSCSVLNLQNLIRDFEYSSIEWMRDKEMDRWIKRWMDGWLDGHMGGVNGWMNRWKDG